MTTKTRYIVIIISLLLITFSFILSTTLYAEANKESHIIRLADGVDEQSGRAGRLEAIWEGPGPQPGPGGKLCIGAWSDV
ncbi:MAG: hypothetical protein OXK78_07015 [Caldilineaceae bacterium]|nr:hypothetical protein [Caldilineaceae bacterium]